MSEYNEQVESTSIQKEKSKKRTILITILLIVFFTQIYIISDSYIRENKGISLFDYLKEKIASIFEIGSVDKEKANNDKYYENYSFENENKSKTDDGLIRIKTLSIVKADKSGGIKVPIKNGSNFSASAMIEINGKKIYESRRLKPNETVVANINVGRESNLPKGVYDAKTGAYFYTVSLKTKETVSLKIKGLFVY